MSSQPPPDDLIKAIGNLRKDIPANLDRVLCFVEEERVKNAKEIASLKEHIQQAEEETAHSQAVVEDVVQPIIYLRADTRITYTNRSFRELTGQNIESLIGSPIGEHITGLDTIDIPIDVEGVAVTVQLAEKGKTTSMKAKVDYHPIREGDKIYYRAIIKLLEPTWGGNIFSWIRIPRKNKPIHLQAQNYISGKTIEVGERTTEGYKHPLFGEIALAYLNYRDKDIALDFKGIEQCNNQFTTNLAQLYTVLQKKRETFTITILNPTEDLRDTLLEAKFPESQIKIVK
tara:strand:- start:87 stop:947 length:861 start_codon:yes stop_codon:yes gene_type:complete